MFQSNNRKELRHTGVIGMKWGVRRSSSASGTSSSRSGSKKETTEKPKVMNVYSSVYVPNNNVVTPEKVETPVVENNDDFDDTMEIELPKLKTEEPILKENSSDSLNLL